MTVFMRTFTRFLAHSLFLARTKSGDKRVFWTNFGFKIGEIGILSYYVCALAAWTFIMTNQLVATTANVPQPSIE